MESGVTPLEDHDADLKLEVLHRSAVAPPALAAAVVLIPHGLDAIVRGFGGCAPDRPVPPQRRERPGVRRGTQYPLARAQCTYTG